MYKLKVLLKLLRILYRGKTKANILQVSEPSLKVSLVRAGMKTKDQMVSFAGT